MEEEIHLSFVIVHLSFGVAQKSPNEYLALNPNQLGDAK
jgi:glutathione S-transferase